MNPEELREVLLDVLQSVLCVEEVELGSRWHDGSLILEPANPDQKPTVIPIEIFWNKIVMVRDACTHEQLHMRVYAFRAGNPRAASTHNAYAPCFVNTTPLRSVPTNQNGWCWHKPTHPS